MRYTQYQRREERPWKVHPIWRGLGCIWMVLLPVMAYAGAWTLTRENFENHWLPVSKDLAQTIQLPVIDWSFLSFPIDLNFLIRWIPGQPLYNLDLLLFVALIFLGFGVSSGIYAFLFGSLTPGRGPLEAPEMDHERRRKKY
jgi:hypothetical protein